MTAFDFFDFAWAADLVLGCGWYGLAIILLVAGIVLLVQKQFVWGGVCIGLAVLVTGLCARTTID